MIPDYPVFNPLDYSHKDELLSAIKGSNYSASEFSLGFLYGYNRSYKFMLTRLNGNICIYAFFEKTYAFLPPLGEVNIPETVNECLKYLIMNHGSGVICAVETELAKKLERNGLKVVLDMDNFDYVYRTTDLANLSGSKYQSKRNFVNGFINSNELEYVELTPELAKECKDFQNAWCEKKACKDDLSLMAENYVVLELLDSLKRFNMFGCVLKIKGKVEAFSIAEKINDKMVLIHVEKADSNFRGIYQAVNNLFCKNELAGRFEFVNREQDVGNEGLRKAKLSYRPAFMVEKYTVEL